MKKNMARPRRRSRHERTIVTVCVIFADIVDWTTLDSGKQIESASELFRETKGRFANFRLKPLWKVPTGDGFGAAFDLRFGNLVLALCADLHDWYWPARSFVPVEELV
jgi:hypothetical protein